MRTLMIIAFFVIGMMAQAQDVPKLDDLKIIEISISETNVFDYYDFTEASEPIRAIDGDNYEIPAGSYSIVDIKKVGSNIKWVTISSMDDEEITLSFKDLVEVYKKKKIIVTRIGLK